MNKTFADLGVPDDITAQLRKRAIERPFPIQEAAIPPALEGRDVCGRAPTGSGKTLAFGIPLVTRIGKAKASRPRALILAPTRELASQIEKELAPLLALKGRRAVSVYGGVGMEPQIRALRRGADVVVACPGRLMDLMNRGALKLSEVEFVVVDEADRMADMGFLPEVRKILDTVRADRQTLLFSATLDGEVDVLIRSYQNNPARCEVAPPDAADDKTTHLFIDTDLHARVDVTADLVRKHGATAVFCRTKHGADRVAQQLSRIGVAAVAIHGNRSQAQRDRALASFKSYKSEVLVATDVAARGIHVDNIGCVVHFDPPTDAKDYVHRSGRTGRAGAEGVVVSLVTPSTSDQVRKLKRQLGFEVGPEPARSKSSGRSRSKSSANRSKLTGGYAKSSGTTYSKPGGRSRPAPAGARRGGGTPSGARRNSNRRGAKPGGRAAA